MSEKKVFDEPTNTEAVDGDVVLEGPDSIDVAMTPNAAEETGWRLIATAKKARDQEPEPEPTKPTP